MTRKIKKAVINVKPKMSGQGKERRKSKRKLKVEERTFHHQQSDGSQGTGDNANQEARELLSTTETGRSERAEDRERTPQQYDCAGEMCTRMAEGGVKIN